MSLGPDSLTGYRNGGIPTIYDLRAGVVCVHGRPQLGDRPVSCGLWLERGVLRYGLLLSCDSKTAIFQRFVILKSERSVSVPVPIGRCARFLWVVVGRGGRRFVPLLVRDAETAEFLCSGIRAPG